MSLNCENMKISGQQRDCSGLGLLIQTALAGDTEKFREVFDCAEVSCQERIDALEIIGATLKMDISFCVMYWEIALDKRSLEHEKLPQRVTRTCAHFPKEFRTYSDLARLSDNRVDFKMQSLWILETFLAMNYQKNKLVAGVAEFNLYRYFFEPEHGVNVADVAANDLFNAYENYFRQFGKMSHLWVFGLSVQLEYLPNMHSSILENFIGLLAFVKLTQASNCLAMLDNESQCRSGSKSLAVLLLSLLKILNFTADPFSTDFSDKTVFSHRSQSSRTLKYPLRNSSSQAWYIFIRVCVVSIRIVADLMASSQFDNDQKILITKMVGSLLSKIKRDRKMAIHMWQCVFRNNLLRRPAESEFIYNDPISLNSVRLLLDCGQDPNAQAGYHPRQTCLNTLIFTRQIKSKFQCDQLIQLLLDRGAHIDYSTATHLTVVDKYRLKYKCSLFQDTVKQPFKHISLQCLSAKVIARKGIKYEGIFSMDLEAFVAKH